ncbi:ribosomal protein S18-alanine N-acetyltransferase [Rheinheimera sp. MMS21-TC3]|uniref:ribosomal protein S18-alanine N-acetyltransferase n=1 Tax=Rheinheimera sp. MMS21-TC3 TaxID=3072790 RepID=UPI0028C3DA19|nr:ribosomal protein S18-alanine N-acetyltransferase [Rheinheimera sp. MMS21-TC3]WNO61512.1 ribosomal protein S18-alanine N-acetyltransferase [Rheinheimera sp. MMS21-TC3]
MAVFATAECGMIFSEITVADIPALHQIELAANPYPWPVTAFQSSLSGLYFNYKLVIDNQLIGFVFCKIVADQAELFNICVNPNHQGKGLGKQLLQKLIADLTAKQVTELWLEVRASNQAAIGLYERFGFSCVDIRPNYYRNAQGAEDAHIMCLYLI